MDPSSTISEALRVIEELDVPAELRTIAFAKAIDLLALGRVSVPPTAQGPADAAAASPGGVRGGGGGPLGQIAHKLALPESTIENAFHVEDGVVDLLVSPNKLDSLKTRGSEQIAVLVAAARQAAGLDEDGWTSVDPIRDACEHFGRLDANNFASTIKNMRDVFLVRGEGRHRKVKLNAPGWQRAAALVNELAS